MPLVTHEACEVVGSRGDGVLDTHATADGALLATAASLFPDPLQTANSEMLFNTVDPLSSINSTMNIHDTFEDGRVWSSSLPAPALRPYGPLWPQSASSSCA